MTATVRDATLEDLSAIVAIYNQTIAGRQSTADLEPASPETKRAWFLEHTTRRRPLWVLEDPEGIRAWLSFQSFYGRPAYDGTAELSIYVHEEARRHGYGRLLLERAIEGAPALSITTLLGFIFGHNTPSLLLFERYGFTRWGTLPRVAVLDGIERDLVIVGRRLSR